MAETPLAATLLWSKASDLAVEATKGGTVTQIALHALSVGEGILALSALPGAGGDYDADVTFIADWRPSIVISLTTMAEMYEAGAERLGSDLRETGTRWIHLPVKDFGVPEESQLDEWQAISDMARSALRGGGRVLVHCRGGCGRSGMIALRLLIEMGEDPSAALGRLRGVRPCAIETDDQHDWSTKARRIPV